jgi:AraC family transcriptional regulator
MPHTTLPPAAARPRVDTDAEAGIEFVRFSTHDVLLGEFRCSPDYVDFRGAGRIRNYVVAFPRTAVWIRREGERAFVCDPSLAVLHSPGHAYERGVISREGDETDWIALSEPLAREIVARSSEADAESLSAFRFGRATVLATLYREQRRLFARLGAADLDFMEIEERAIAIVANAIGMAYAESAHTLRPAVERRRGARDLVESAKEILAATLSENLSLRSIAARLDVSPFHLCRSFRAGTGRTLFEHRRDLRLRVALGLIPTRRGSLSALAIDLGFHSHAHLTSSFRRAFGVPPRSLLQPFGGAA